MFYLTGMMLLEVSNVTILRWDLLLQILYSPPLPMALHAAAKLWKYMSLWLSSLFFPFSLQLCCVQSLCCVQLLATLWTVTLQAALSMGFPRQEYWSGLPFPPTGALPHPGIEPVSPALQADSLPAEPSGKPSIYLFIYLSVFFFF